MTKGKPNNSGEHGILPPTQDNAVAAAAALTEEKCSSVGSSINKNKVHASSKSSPPLLQQEKRYLSYPNYTQKATEDGNNTNDRPTPNRNDDQQLAWACAEEELENKRKAKQMAGAGQPKKLVEIDRKSREIQIKKEMDMEKSNSFNILSVVQERLSTSHAENELEKKRKAKLMADAGQPKMLGDVTVDRNSREIQKKKEMDIEKSNSFNILSVVQERLSTTHPENEISRPTTTRPSRSARQPQQSEPGAYAGAPGTTMDRVDNLRFSLVGRDSYSPGERKPSSKKISGKEDHSPAQAAPTTALLPEWNNNEELVEAMPITERTLSEAKPIDQENLYQKESEETKFKRWKTFANCGIAAVACLVLTLALAIGLQRKGESIVTVDTDVPTPSPTRPLPPMENLELLYVELPAKTKESLYNKDSSQYHAWEWLLNHPNITTYPEWRKKQIFAMATFFYSFEGPNWPKEFPGRDRWMNTSTSECYWMETEIIARVSFENLGPDAYGLQEYQPCNEGGQLQSLIVDQLYLPTNAKPMLPPEIEFLTSLKIVAIIVGQIRSKLSDLVIPELRQLPTLAALSFYSSGVSGTIPKELSTMTGLRHLLLGVNQLTSTIPTAIGKMTSLEYFNLGNNEVSGFVPSHLGLLTSMTSLELEHNHFRGSIPSEVGSMTNIQSFWLGNNALTQSLPSELGLMANVIDLRLGNDLGLQGSYNEFSGSLPGELWGLSHVETFSLSNLPSVSGRLPNEIMMPNLTSFSLSGSPQLSGTIPDSLCSVQKLNVDCSDLLCGCYCPCIGTINQTSPLDWNQKSLP